MGEEVMAPVFAILIGAVLIAVGLLTQALVSPWIRILLGAAGVATILLGMAMLFGLAYGKGKEQKR